MKWRELQELLRYCHGCLCALWMVSRRLWEQWNKPTHVVSLPSVARDDRSRMALVAWVDCVVLSCIFCLQLVTFSHTHPVTHSAFRPWWVMMLTLCRQVEVKGTDIVVNTLCSLWWSAVMMTMMTIMMMMVIVYLMLTRWTPTHGRCSTLCSCNCICCSHSTEQLLLLSIGWWPKTTASWVPLLNP